MIFVITEHVVTNISLQLHAQYFLLLLHMVLHENKLNCRFIFFKVQWLLKTTF